MDLFLDSQMKDIFGHDAAAFDTIMALSGEIYREQEGRKTQRIQLTTDCYFVKQHTGVGWLDILKNIICGRLPVISAKQEWRAILHLEQIGMSTLQIAGYGKKGWNPAAMRSFLITKELLGVISLEKFFEENEWMTLPFLFKHYLIRALAENLKRMHDSGINHRDCYLCHFLLDISHGQDQLLTAPIILYVIDLHRAQIRKKVPERWIIKDLAGLYFSSKKIGLRKSDYYRFLKTYEGRSLREILNKKAQRWRRVKKKGDALCDKHAI